MTTPTGQAIDDAAAAIVDAIVDSVIDMPEVDRYAEIVMWRQVLLVAAQKLTIESGFPLAALNQRGLSHRKISAELGRWHIPLSAAAVGDLIRATSPAGQQTR